MIRISGNQFDIVYTQTHLQWTNASRMSSLLGAEVMCISKYRCVTSERAVMHSAFVTDK